MSTLFGEYLSIARVTTVQRDRSVVRMMKSVAGLMLLTFVIAGGLMVWGHVTDTRMPPKTTTVSLVQDLARGALGLMTFWFAIGWGTVFIPGSVLMNSAANARLLPRQRRRLMQMAAAGWLACTLAFAAVFESWTVAPLCGLYMIGLPMLLVGRKQAVVLVFMSCGWPILSHTVLTPALLETLTRPASLAALSLLLLPLGAYALRVVYPAGGDTHIAQRADVLKRMERQTTRSPTDMGAVDGKGTARAYGLVLRRDCRRADPATMLLHALGPTAHWSVWFGSMFWMLGAGLLLRLLAVWGGVGAAHDFMKGVSGGLSAACTVVLFSTAQFGQQMRRTHGEQALLRLTPLAGDSALLNRRLARQLLKVALYNWGLITAAILGATLLVGGDGEALLRQFSLSCLCGQVALMGVLGDYAREAGWNLMLALRAALVAIVEAAVAFGLGWYVGPSIWAWTIFIAVVAGVFQVMLGRRRMLEAPAAFPAGRLA